MNDSPPLLTIVLEVEGAIDRESLTYRRILSARLRFEHQYQIVTADGPLGTTHIRELCEKVESTYILFIRSTHSLSPTYLTGLLEHLRGRQVYLTEPYTYTGELPKRPARNKDDDGSHYVRDTDVYGIAFNTRRMRDALEAVGDIDRSALYLAYRLYWNIGNVKPLPIGYSMASDTKAAIGLRVEHDVSRLLPLIPTSSRTMRLYALRYLVLFLMGIRRYQSTNVPLDHVRDYVRLFKLVDVATVASRLQPFEVAFIRWLQDPQSTEHLYKQLTEGDAYLIFSDQDDSTPVDVPLYELNFGKDVVTIGKSYLPRDRRPGYSRASSYDFYGRRISKHSTLLFFDRPMQADDNAEHLYQYFRSHHPEFEEIYFALNPKSPDWPRLEKLGFNLVHMFSKEFYEKFLISDAVISSQIYSLSHRGKSLANSRFVYLQHGVQLNDMTNWVVSKYFDVFVATGKLEADYLSKVAPVETLNSGLPRMESLTRSKSDSAYLLFMPTWRFRLHQSSDENFRCSEYCRAVNSILTDPDLLKYLERSDRTLRVKLHPNVEKRVQSFRWSERVQVATESYREALACADFVFTDYSSAVLDAAFIGTPIAYYQWDAADFFHEQPYGSRLDYTTEGLGPVYFDHAELIEYICTEQFLEESEIYQRRRARFFEGVDPKGINAAIFERMMAL